MIGDLVSGLSPLGTKGLCLLSLDGGGVRGLSSLLILRDIMTQLNAERDDNQDLRPCDVFDLIGGTSTGGYVDWHLSETIFNPEHVLIYPCLPSD